MAWGCFVVLLLLVAAPLRLGQRLPLKPGFEYSYDCGVRGMQLLVFPRPNQTIQFKVLGECWQMPFPISHAQSQAQPAARRELDLFRGVELEEWRPAIQRTARASLLPITTEEHNTHLSQSP